MFILYLLESSDNKQIHIYIYIYKHMFILYMLEPSGNKQPQQLSTDCCANRWPNSQGSRSEWPLLYIGKRVGHS